MSYYRKFETIPANIFDSIDVLSKKHGGNRWKQRFDNYLKIVGTIYYQCITIAEAAYYFHPIAREYWRTIDIGRVHVYVKELEDEGIIETTRIKRRNYYRLSTNKILEVTTLVDVPLYFSKAKNISKKYKTESVTNEFPFIEKRLGKRITKCLKKISLDESEYHEAKKAGLLRREEESYKIDISEFPDNLNLKGEIHFPFDIKVQNYHVKTLKKHRDSLNLPTFYAKDRIVIDNPNNFITRKTLSLYSHFDFFLIKIKASSFEIIRDQNKTRRVFYPLVFLPSIGLNFVRIEGTPVCGIDAKTSQFALAANLFHHFIESGDKVADSFTDKRKTFIKNLFLQFTSLTELASQNSVKVVKRFYEDVIERDFYEVIRKELGVSTRGQAKIFCFSLLFSSDESSNPFKKKIQERYPSVIDALEAFKSKYGYEQLSINLQALEAEIFIDKIFNLLFKNKITCFTRHDSVIIREDRTEEAKSIMNNYFKSIGFRINLEVEDYSLPMETDSDEDDIDYFDHNFFNELRERHNAGSLNPMDYYFLMEEGKRIINQNEYNELESRVLELIHNHLPLDSYSLNTINSIISSLSSKYSPL